MSKWSRLLIALAVVSIAHVSAERASAVVIDFNDGVDGAAVGGLYAGLGVTFSNAEFDGFISPGEGAAGASGLKIVGIPQDYVPKVGNPIVAVFSSPLSFVSILGLNVGANGARLDAYDSAVGGALLDFDSAFGAGFGVDNHPLLSVAASGIRRIELYQPLSVQDEGLLFDNLTFEVEDVAPVPEPGTLLLLGGGLSALATRRRRAR